MPVETATYISDLVPANPPATDPLSQADDHIRLVKTVLQDTFPSATAPVTASPTNLNNGYIPVGGIIMWSGSVLSIPTNWHLCDGTLGTPDLRDKFVVGAGSTYAVDAIGGSTTATAATDSQGAHTHGGATATHALTAAEMPAHEHFGGAGMVSYNTGTLLGYVEPTPSGTNLYEILDSSQGGGAAHSHGISSDGAHTHSVTVSTMSPYLALAFIQRIS